jgi:hypothetical protein
MDDDTLRARLAYALVMALGASAAPGCCETTERELIEQEGLNGPTSGWGAQQCREVCLNRPDCAPDKRLLSCGFTGAPGARTLRCVFEYSDCPTAPVPYAACGRRHEGASPTAEPATRDPLGRCFAAMEALEAGSVPAFQRLACELVAHGAPDDLVRDARRAVSDERRHAALMARLARAHGVEASSTPVAVGALRPLEAVALENAVEGCVGETWGALVALWQAQRALDPDVRAVMQSVAADELRHAALAWRVDAWARARLSADAARRVREARDQRLATLRAERRAVDPAVSRGAGLPSPREAARLLDACERALWAVAA